MAEPENFDDADDPYRAIRIGDPGVAGEATKWGHLLTRFMRVMAVFWLLQGLAQWQVILTAQKSIFDTMPQSAALAVIFFGVLDLVAGVGLWLATPWGGVLWLLIASAQIFVAASLPSFFAGGYWLIGVDVLLIVLYFVLTFEAGRDFEAQKVMEERQRRRSLILRQTASNASPEPPPGRMKRVLEGFARPKRTSEKTSEAAPRPQSQERADQTPAAEKPASTSNRASAEAPQPNKTPEPATATADPAQERLARLLQSAGAKKAPDPAAPRPPKPGADWREGPLGRALGDRASPKKGGIKAAPLDIMERLPPRNRARSGANGQS
jgi:hypothetical protein